MPTFAEAQTTTKVEARKRVYVALSEVKRLMTSLDIVPNMRDYPDIYSFESARRIHRDHLQAVIDLQNEMTRECRILQGR